VRSALEHRFDHIQIEGEHGFGKLEERAYNHAMEVLGVGPPGPLPTRTPLGQTNPNVRTAQKN
jgi:FMN phosphatase YigB (HAD superfamily)